MHAVQDKGRIVKTLLASYAILGIGLVVELFFQNCKGIAAGIGTALFAVSLIHCGEEVAKQVLLCWLPFSVFAFFWLFTYTSFPSVLTGSGSEETFILSIVLVVVSVVASSLSILNPKGMLVAASWIVQGCITIAFNCF